MTTAPFVAMGLVLLVLFIHVIRQSLDIGALKEQRRDMQAQIDSFTRRIDSSIEELIGWADEHEASHTYHNPARDKAWTTMLNRRVPVENILAECATGQRPPLTKEQCRDLAKRLGDPNHQISKETWR